MSVVNRVRQHRIYRSRLTADYVNRTIVAGGAFNNLQQAAMSYFDRNLKASGLQGNCEEVFLFLGGDQASVTQKFIYVSNAAATNSNFVTGDVSNNGVVRDSANASKYWNSNYNAASDSVGKESSLGVWWYTGQTESAGTSRALMGADILIGTNQRPALIGWVVGGSTETGGIATDGATASQTATGTTTASTGLLGVQNPGTRNPQFNLNGVDTGAAGTTGTISFPSGNLYMFARNSSGTADLFARRDGRFAAITNGIGPRTAAWYRLIQSYQQFLNRAV